MKLEIDWSKSHNGVMLCDYNKTIELMPESKEILDDFFENISLTYKKQDYLIDIKVHMLMPEQFPCIPNWHCDFVPRDKELNLRKDLIMFDKMYLWVSGEPKTEFRYSPEIVDTGNIKWVEFTQLDEHRGVKATERTWRCFIRIIPKCLIKDRPTGNKNDSHRGTLRRHSQVYLDSNKFNW